MAQSLPSLALTAAALGLSAGFSPGPLFSLVLTQTLRHGTAEGVKVALAPVVTDAPIIVLCWLALSRFSGTPAVLGAVSLAGAALLARYGLDCFRVAPPAAEAVREAPRSLWRGVAANFTNPHPYLFWTAVGVPLLLEAQASGPAGAAVFLAFFYVAIVGAKVAAAVVTGRCGRFLSGRAYRLLMGALGLSLFYFAATFVRQGLTLLAGP
ncbi:LysE family transporter [Solidesulfovibrio sp.]|uniref:LysE family transporter n=1 Tax=Solidesulfovibrio sp. TaxID=2910990 RepID=UPI00260E0327|nr:LysE family transporter [Solidesulfovibrio sp.]